MPHVTLYHVTITLDSQDSDASRRVKAAIKCLYPPQVRKVWDPILASCQLSSSTNGQRIGTLYALVTWSKSHATFYCSSLNHTVAVMPSAHPVVEESAPVESTSHALLAFLQSQSQNTLTRLYQKPSSCLSIFRFVQPYLMWWHALIAEGVDYWVLWSDN